MTILSEVILQVLSGGSRGHGDTHPLSQSNLFHFQFSSKIMPNNSRMFSNRRILAVVHREGVNASIVML